MKVTYIHHSSFLVELSGVSLLFDYYSGVLPEISKEKPLIVFASHFHGDHYDPVIFKLAQERENCFYVLSDDIRKNRKKDIPEELFSKIHFVKPEQKFSMSYRNSVSEPGADIGIEIETFRSTDEGVAFWLCCEGKTLYHAGDLNNWWWEGEEKAWNHNMAANYSRELDKMAGRVADAAFIPLDPRLEQWFYLGMDQFMKKSDAKVIFSMHFWGDYDIIKKMKEHPCSEAYREKIIEIHKESEEFEV